MATFHRYAQISTYHGVKDWYKSMQTKFSLLKLFWSLILIAALTVAAYYTYLLIKQYRTKNTATKITPKATSEIQFPNITIAASGRFNISHLKSQKMNFIFEEATMEQWHNYLSLMSFAIDRAKLFEADRVLAWKLEQNYQRVFNQSLNPAALDPTEYVNNATFQCSKILKKCNFAFVDFDCCKQVITLFGDWAAIYQLKTYSSSITWLKIIFGTCTLAVLLCYMQASQRLPTNTDGFTYQTQPGIIGGLQLHLESNKTNIMVSNVTDVFGFRAQITDVPSQFDFSPVYLKAGTKALVKINAKHYMLNPAIENCLVNPSPVNGRSVYSKSLCQQHCLIEMTMAKCQCRPYLGKDLPVQNNSCTPWLMLTCVFPLISGNSTDSLMILDATSECMSKECPNKCSYWIYEPSVTYGKVSQRSNPPEIVSSVLNVFYGELSYYVVEEVILMDFNTFVSNIGNLVGLYTGISVISLVQCASICLFGKCTKKRKS